MSGSSLLIRCDQCDWAWEGPDPREGSEEAILHQEETEHREFTGEWSHLPVKPLDFVKIDFVLSEEKE